MNTVTVWTLIVILFPGYNSSSTIVINQLPTYAECARVEKEVVKQFMPNDARYKTSCIEVLK